MWGDKSFMVEVKPTSDMAAVFIDSPPPANGTETELIRLLPTAIQFLSLAEKDADGKPKLTMSDLAGIHIYPDKVVAPTFVDKHRLFMCKAGVKVEGLKTVRPKNFVQLAKEIEDVYTAKDLVEDAKGKAFRLECTNCSHRIFFSEAGQFQLNSIKTDDYLHTSPEMEYFCGHCCGGVDKCGGTHDLTEADHEMAKSRWFPGKKRIIVSPTFVMVLKSILQKETIDYDVSSCAVTCFKCHAEVGRVDRRFKDIISFHTSVTDFIVGYPRNPKKSFQYYERRFLNDDRFFAWMLLSHCEGQSSIKLVIRSFDKTPYLLIWMLDSYVVMATGELSVSNKHDEFTSNLELESDSEQKNDSPEAETQESKHLSKGQKKKRRQRMKKAQNSCDSGRGSLEPSEGEAEDVSTPFPAIKMLFKVFDAQTARSDPRANGQDASVALVDVPLPCALKLTHLLLQRCRAMPPTMRSVGQFYVGYLQLAKSFEAAVQN